MYTFLKSTYSILFLSIPQSNFVVNSIPKGHESSKYNDRN